MAKYKSVLIEWEDSQISPQGWARLNSFTAAIPTMHSIGFVIREDKKSISLASSIGEETDSSDEQVCNTITIPKRCIIKRKTISF